MCNKTTELPGFYDSFKITFPPYHSSAPLRERNNGPSYIRQIYFNPSHFLDNIKKRCEKLKNVKIVS